LSSCVESAGCSTLSASSNLPLDFGYDSSSTGRFLLNQLFELQSRMIDPRCVGRLSYLRTQRFKGEDSLAHTSPFTAFYSTLLTDKGEACLSDIAFGGVGLSRRVTFQGPPKSREPFSQDASFGRPARQFMRSPGLVQS
jgi:hypothetical protein